MLRRGSMVYSADSLYPEALCGLMVSSCRRRCSISPSASIIEEDFPRRKRIRRSTTGKRQAVRTEIR